MRALFAICLSLCCKWALSQTPQVIVLKDITYKSYTKTEITLSDSVPKGESIELHFYGKDGTPFFINIRQANGLYFYSRDEAMIRSWHCGLSRDSIYSITLKKVCLKDLTDQEYYYNYFVDFADNTDCSKFIHRQIPHKTSYGLTRGHGRFIDMDNRLYEVVRINPCGALLDWHLFKTEEQWKEFLYGK